MDSHVRSAHPGDLDGATAYRILRLRTDVFVVEQECPYPDLDGRDLEPGARWVWAAAGDEVVATLRILAEPGGRMRVGRVATAQAARSSGIATRLMTHALGLIGPGVEIVLSAQEHLESWYEKFGFARTGKTYTNDGIPHLPMLRLPDH